LFNCAGGSLADDGLVTEVDLALWEPTMATNVRGTIHCCRAAIPEMARSGGGSIVNMTSICALSGNHPLHLYAAAKGSIISLTKVLAGQYWRDAIRANAIAPGSVLTERVRARMDALNRCVGQQFGRGGNGIHDASIRHRRARRSRQHCAVPGVGRVAHDHRRGHTLPKAA
jgi:NAD(P)-dependent dehydrogenase (short-subunit alcohol dehydrogenase family)